MKILPPKYAQLIYDLTKDLREDEVGQVLNKIAKMIIQNGDSGKLGQIIDCYERTFDIHQGIVKVQVISAEKLTEQRLGALKEMLARKNSTEKSKIELKNMVDKGIKGGLIIKIGNELIDASLNNKLEKLKSAIAS